MSYLNRKLQGKAPCRYYLVCVPITSTDVPFWHYILPRDIEKAQGYYFKQRPPEERQQLQRAHHLRIGPRCATPLLPRGETEGSG